MGSNITRNILASNGSCKAKYDLRYRKYIGSVTIACREELDQGEVDKVTSSIRMALN